MKYTWQGVMPFIAPKNNLEECLASMGEITIPILVVDNSPTSVTREMQLHPNIEVSYHPENLGVPAAWNMGIDKGADQTLIISASMRFGGRFKDFIEGADKRANSYGLSPRMAMHLWVVGRQTVDEIGKYDEHFYPSYWDDVDIWRRMIVAGITGCGQSELPYYHPDYVTCIGDAVALKSGVLKVNFQKNLDYYILKWGGDAKYEKYDHPFNNNSLPLSYTGDPTS